jgi:hypothetical protein
VISTTAESFTANTSRDGPICAVARRRACPNAARRCTSAADTTVERPLMSAKCRLSSDQEVLRANRELAAYFRGRRTEREARAALKIIKAFVRDRGNRDAKSRPPLPGLEMARTPKEIRKAPQDTVGRHRRTPQHKRRVKTSTRVGAPVERHAHTEPQGLSDTDETPS